MLKSYEKFLIEFDKKLEEYFVSQKEYIKCSKGCTNCCEVGEYPYSRLEAEYLMKGFLTLPAQVQKEIKQNISKLLAAKKQNQCERFNYCCPFLINNLCSLYNFRGITCRVFGLAYLDKNYIKLPECANLNLNYSDVFNKNTKEIFINNLITDNLRIDNILRSPLAEKYNLECGEIRPLIEWFISN